MSTDTCATAAENFVWYFKIYSLLRSWRIQSERKNQSDTTCPSVLYTTGTQVARENISVFSDVWWQNKTLLL